MKSPLFFFLAATILILLESCSQKVFFCNQIRTDYHVTESQLKQSVFFTSGKLILYEAEPLDKEKPQTITVPKGTPVIVEKVGPDRLGVRFEPGDNRLLFFGAKEPLGSYAVLAQEWSDGHGLVEYGNKKYFIVPGGGDVMLTILKNALAPRSQPGDRRAKGLIH